MFSTFRKLTNRMTLPALILPAVLVTMASLLALISTAITSAAASQPGELLFPLRQPALEFQLALTRDPDERAAIELQMGAALPDAGAAAGEVFESTDDDGGNGAAGQEVKEDRSGADDGDVDGRGDGPTGQGDEGATGEQGNGDDSGGDGDDEVNEGDGSTGQGGSGDESGAGVGDDDDSIGDDDSDSGDDEEDDDSDSDGDDADNSGDDGGDGEDEDDDSGPGGGDD